MEKDDVAWIYEKLGSCELCHVDGESLFRRMINGHRMPMAVLVCGMCIRDINDGTAASLCSKCAAEKRPVAPGSYVCPVCR